MYRNDYNNNRRSYNNYDNRRDNYRPNYGNSYNRRNQKMDYLKFVDMSTFPATEFSHYGCLIVPQIGDKIIEGGVTYVVMDRKFCYDEERIILNIERAEE